ncbi:hypothetical protein [Pseudomonas sp.]|uniref:hypothetical protein n=1 Tax=Pseudomonas sp. TaxID=306 RepID=UPI0027369BFB|nr:hypothetical protein [Pseudomonas sp.]MDP3814298.1 hypothetical protein [Pseudomonas sp.]
MKKLLLLLAIGSAGYYYYTTQYASVSASVDSYQALLKKVETTPVTREEVKMGANELAHFLCTGSPVVSSSECLNKYANYKEMCESRIFGGAPDTYSRKDEVIAVAKNYRTCVGII